MKNKQIKHIDNDVKKIMEYKEGYFECENDNILVVDDTSIYEISGECIKRADDKNKNR